MDETAKKILKGTIKDLEVDGVIEPVESTYLIKLINSDIKNKKRAHEYYLKNQEKHVERALKRYYERKQK